MRIVHLAKYYPPEWGGMERVTFDLVNGMAAKGIRSHVVAFTRDASQAGGTYGEIVEITRCRMFANPANQPISLSWLWCSLSAGAKSDAVIVHAPNFLALLVLVGLRLLRLVGIGPRHRLLLWHSDIVEKGALGLIVRPLELAMAMLATRIIATSPPYAEASNVLRRFSARLEIIPLGIDPVEHTTSQFQLDPDLARWIDGRPLVLAVGRLVPYKGFDILIDAAGRLTDRLDICCLIVGTGPEAHRLNNLIAASGLADSVRIVGPVNAAQLDALYRTAAVYCMSSRLRSEAFGVVLLEAMSYGVPIVATSIEGSGVPWVAGSETSLIVPVENADALACAIEEIVTDPELARRLGKAALGRYAARFKRAQMVESFVALLTDEGAGS